MNSTLEISYTSRGNNPHKFDPFEQPPNDITLTITDRTSEHSPLSEHDVLRVLCEAVGRVGGHIGLSESDVISALKAATNRLKQPTSSTTH
jgi:hypothetical protein